uniref:Uncharacterized protein n=1 Tax=Rhizophora mucronata TaxID=61149 RepID=A0A2P2PYN4_RHIMU
MFLIIHKGWTLPLSYLSLSLLGLRKMTSVSEKRKPYTEKMTEHCRRRQARQLLPVFLSSSSTNDIFVLLHISRDCSENTTT